MTWLTVTEYMCLKWPRICSVCRNNNPVLDSFITYYRVCNKSNTMGATCGAGTANPSVGHEFTPVFNEVRIARCAFSVSLFVLLSLYFCPLCCVSFFYLRLLITPLVSSNNFWLYTSSVCHYLSYYIAIC